MKEYLIAYLTYNGNVLPKRIFANSQKDAIRKFNLYNANCDILAVTLIEVEE